MYDSTTFSFLNYLISACTLAVCVIIICYNYFRRRKKCCNSHDAVQKKSYDLNPFPQDDFSSIASGFSGLYEMLYISVHNEGKDLEKNLNKWLKRASLHNERPYINLRLYLECHLQEDKKNSLELLSFARNFLDSIKAIGIIRDSRQSIILSESLPSEYFIEDSLDFDSGDIADVKYASWSLNNSLIEKGTLVLRSK